MAVQKVKLKIGTVYQKEEGGIYYIPLSGQRSPQSDQPENTKQAGSHQRGGEARSASASDIIRGHRCSRSTGPAHGGTAEELAAHPGMGSLRKKSRPGDPRHGA